METKNLENNTNAKKIIAKPICKWDLQIPGKRYFSATGATDEWGNYQIFFVLTNRKTLGSMNARITDTNNSLFTFVETSKGWKVKIHNFVEHYKETIFLEDLGVVFMNKGARKIIHRYTGVMIPYVDFITGLPKDFVVTDEGIEAGVFPDKVTIPYSQISDEQMVNSICNRLIHSIFGVGKRSQA